MIYRYIYQKQTGQDIDLVELYGVKTNKIYVASLEDKQITTNVKYLEEFGRYKKLYQLSNELVRAIMEDVHNINKDKLQNTPLEELSLIN